MLSTDQRPFFMAAIEAASPYWALEHEIAERYFTHGKRTKATDLTWVGHQMFKEWTGSGVYGPKLTTVATLIQEAASEVAALAKDGTAPSPLRSTCTKLSFAADELRHYAQLYNLYFMMEPSQEIPTVDSLGTIEDGKRLTDLRLRWRTDPLGEVAVDLSEGGGLGLYFGIRSVAHALQTTDPVDREILNVAERTIEDESQHILGRFRSVAAKQLSAKDWTVVTTALTEISHQKLLERNKQFSSPLEPESLESVMTEATSQLTTKFLNSHLKFLLKGLEIETFFGN